MMLESVLMALADDAGGSWLRINTWKFFYFCSNFVPDGVVKGNRRIEVTEKMQIQRECSV